MSAVAIIGAYGARIDDAANQFLSQNDSTLYDMLRYFMGYLNENLEPVTTTTGKRLRPGLLLYLAEALGVQEESRSAALSIELFHNFTLIHDDIEDHDELRRGRPTVWKVWGINKALNAGDAQLILALRALRTGSQLTNEKYVLLEEFLLTQYGKVIEGQHQDFVLTEAGLADPAVTEEAYLDMISKKSGVLIGASAKAAGIVAGCTDAQCEALYTFGHGVGVAYQLYDDQQSLWGDIEVTGKTTGGDIVERKKTLPVLFARDHLGDKDAASLVAAYANKEDTATDILKLIEQSGALEYLRAHIEIYSEQALQALGNIPVRESERTLLAQFVRELTS